MVGGFKVLINGQIERHCSFAVDFDEGIFWGDADKKTASRKFNRKNFAVMSITVDDMEEIKIPSKKN